MKAIELAYIFIWSESKEYTTNNTLTKKHLLVSRSIPPNIQVYFGYFYFPISETGGFGASL